MCAFILKYVYFNTFIGLMLKMDVLFLIALLLILLFTPTKSVITSWWDKKWYIKVSVCIFILCHVTLVKPIEMFHTRTASQQSSLFKKIIWMLLIWIFPHYELFISNLWCVSAAALTCFIPVLGNVTVTSVK